MRLFNNKNHNKTPTIRPTQWSDLPNDQIYPTIRSTQWSDLPNDQTYPMIRSTEVLTLNSILRRQPVNHSDAVGNVHLSLFSLCCFSLQLFTLLFANFYISRNQQVIVTVTIFNICNQFSVQIDLLLRRGKLVLWTCNNGIIWLLAGEALMKTT